MPNQIPPAWSIAGPLVSTMIRSTGRDAAGHHAEDLHVEASRCRPLGDAEADRVLPRGERTRGDRVRALSQRRGRRRCGRRCGGQRGQDECQREPQARRSLHPTVGHPDSLPFQARPCVGRRLTRERPEVERFHAEFAEADNESMRTLGLRVWIWTAVAVVGAVLVATPALGQGSAPSSSTGVAYSIQLQDPIDPATQKWVAAPWTTRRASTPSSRSSASTRRVACRTRCVRSSRTCTRPRCRWSSTSRQTAPGRAGRGLHHGGGATWPRWRRSHQHRLGDADRDRPDGESQDLSRKIKNDAAAGMRALAQATAATRNWPRSSSPRRRTSRRRRRSRTT